MVGERGSPGGGGEGGGRSSRGRFLFSNQKKHGLLTKREVIKMAGY